MEEDNRRGPRSVPRTLFNAISGAGAFIFLFGDVFLRRVCGFSFSTSILAWVAILGALLIIAIIVWHFGDL